MRPEGMSDDDWLASKRRSYAAIIAAIGRARDAAYVDTIIEVQMRPLPHMATLYDIQREEPEGYRRINEAAEQRRKELGGT